MNTDTKPARTPGPWTVKVKPDRTMMIAAPAGHYIAKVVGSTVVGDQRVRFAADAALIAAAPEMLAALSELVLEALRANQRAGVVHQTVIEPGYIATARAAIAKATGG